MGRKLKYDTNTKQRDAKQRDETTVSEIEQTPTVHQLATAAGLLPEQLPGNRLHPIKLNHKTWQLKVAMRRKGWSLDSFISQQEFDAAINEVTSATAR